MGEFDAIIGYKFLSGMHLNDAKFGLGSKKDRHESLGKGELGFSAFKNIIKKQGSTETRTRIAGFKVQSAHHYTMEP